MKRFKEFLTEMFSIRETAFGIDTKDGKIHESNLGYSTYLEYEGIKVKVLISKKLHTLVYGVFSEEKDKWILEPSKSNISFKNMLDFYSKIIYISLQVLKKSGLADINFTRADDRLEQLYSKMVKSKSFINLLDSLDMEVSTNKEEYTIRKKK